MRPKRFGIIGYFGTMMLIRIKHKDSINQDKVNQLLLKYNYKSSRHDCYNGSVIYDIIGDEFILKQLMKITIRRQINRLEDKLESL